MLSKFAIVLSNLLGRRIDQTSFKLQVSRNADNHPAFLAVYNMETTEIIAFYQVSCCWLLSDTSFTS